MNAPATIRRLSAWVLLALVFALPLSALAQTWSFDGPLDRFMSKADQQDCSNRIWGWWPMPGSVQKGFICLKDHVTDPRQQVACWHSNNGSRTACDELYVRYRAPGADDGAQCDGKRKGFWMNARDPNLYKGASKYGAFTLSEGSARTNGQSGPMGLIWCDGRNHGEEGDVDHKWGIGTWSCHTYSCCCDHR